MKKTNFNLIDSIKRYFEIRPYKDIITWAQQNIDFSEQISAQRNKLDFQMYPYQVPILKEWENDKKLIKTITVVAPEQTGKTNMFVVGLLWNMQFNPCQSLIVYPNDDDAIRANQTKLLPLMKHIPLLKRQFESKRCYTRDSYRFTNLISYFQGAGSKIVSKSCKIVIGDEVDAWPNLTGIDNVRDLKKRTRSYNSSICFLISSPTTDKGKIWRSFEDGSRGYWYLRCKNCGELTMRSCDTNNLQFKSEIAEETNQRVVIPDSCRLICPKCKHQHVQADKKWMNVNGGFIHLVPQKLDTNPSFQLGALASQLPSLAWPVIAQEQLNAGKRADIDAHINFDNSYRGLPYHRRQIVKEDIQKIRDHEYKDKESLKPEQIQFVFTTFDTMDQYFRYGIFASDIYDNIHVLKFGETKYLQLDENDRQMINSVLKEEARNENKQFEAVETVEDIMEKTYAGFKPIINVIDSRGHRTKQIQKFVATHVRAAGWYGGKVPGQKGYKRSQIPRSFLVSAMKYKVQAIFHLHAQKKRQAEYLFFYNNVQQKFIDEIVAMKPDYNRNSGQQYENWTSEDRADHTFDVIKMAYFTRDFCIDKNNFSKDRFAYCQSPRLKLEYGDIIRHETEIAKKQIHTNQNNKSWIQNNQKSWLKI